MGTGPFWDGHANGVETCHIGAGAACRGMGRGANVLHPRSLVPAGIGVTVRERRLALGWSQDRLAGEVFVSRRTIVRLEAGSHRPGVDLVQSLEEALDVAGLVPGWKEATTADAPSLGPRCRLARLVGRLTQAEVARAAGIGVATLSRFERELGDTPLLLSGWDEAPRFENVAYAHALGFEDASELLAFCMSGDPWPWLPRLAGRSVERRAADAFRCLGEDARDGGENG